MNKRNKIIVSIVGITIVLLALLGITYAYYLTRIQGNTNTNSISITTADLKLEYGDGTTQILTKENIVPDNNNPLGTKDFTVSNTGNTTIENYKVVLEYAVIDGVVPSVFVYPEDFEITLTCVSKNIETNEVSGTCSGASLKWNNESVEIVKNTIDSKIRHEYSLEIYYKDSGIDQSDDMGKNLNLKVQIYGANETSTVTGTISNVDSTYAMKLNSNPKISTIKNVGTEDSPIYQYKFIGVEADTHTLTLVDKNNSTQSSGSITINIGTNATIDGSTITVKDNQTNIFLTTTGGSSTLTSTATFNPYSSNTNSLAYHILNNALNKTNGTEYRDIPITTPANEKNVTWGTGEFITENVATSSLCSEYYPWLIGDSESAAENGSYVDSYDEAIDSYVYDQCSGWIKYLESYDSATSTLTFIEEKITGASIISLAEDDDGISYYYRGLTEDNYVTFAGMCWRIVRINGNGSTKLILEDQDEVCSTTMNGNWNIEASDGTNITMDTSVTPNVPYRSGNFGYDDSSGKSKMSYLNPLNNTNRAMVNAFKYFQINTLTNKISSIYEDKSLSDFLISGNWCLNSITYSDSTGTTLLENPTYTSYFFYDSNIRLDGKTTKEPTLKCPVESLEKFADNTTPMYVGTLTADEIVYAGGKVDTRNLNYYLINEWQNNNSSSFWSISPSYFSGYTDGTFNVSNIGSLDFLNVNNIGEFRPSVSLVPSAVITSGDGTLETPYIIAE